MSSDSHESILWVAGSELGEESMIKAKSGYVVGDHSSSIVVNEYSVEKKLPRSPVTRSASKSKLSALAADSNGAAASRADNPLHPPKGEVTMSFWSLEFGLRLPSSYFIVASCRFGDDPYSI
ncbi:hypothetical protein ACOSP7_013283 [Xanthoceras sorbifolium]